MQEAITIIIVIIMIIIIIYYYYYFFKKMFVKDSFFGNGSRSQKSLKILRSGSSLLHIQVASFVLCVPQVFI